MSAKNGNGEEPKYSHGFKLIPTAKGYRIELHCYANSAEDVVDETMKTLKLAEERLRAENKPLAPMGADEK